MRTILYITELLPFPHISGGRIKTWHTIQALARKYQVHVVCQTGNRKDFNYLPNISSQNISFKCFYNSNVNKDYRNHKFEVFKKFLQGLPLYAYRYQNHIMKKYLNRFIKENRIVAIHIDHIDMAQFLPDEKTVPWIHEEHNIEYLLNWRRFLFSKKLKRKLFFLSEAIISFFYELRHLHRFNHLFAISQNDRQILSQKFFLSLKRTSVFPPIYHPTKTKFSAKQSKAILFIGGLNWNPNKDAITWFCRKIFPLVLKKIPNAKLEVIGQINKYIHPSIYKTPGTVFHGFRNNIKPLLQRASIFILPFRVGEGVRIKALTALSYNIPIVSTKLGIKGLSLSKNQGVLVADQPEIFSQHIVSLINNPQKQKQLVKNNRQYLINYHGEEQITQFLKTYAKITG